MNTDEIGSLKLKLEAINNENLILKEKVTALEKSRPGSGGGKKTGQDCRDYKQGYN